MTPQAFVGALGRWTDGGRAPSIAGWRRPFARRSGGARSAPASGCPPSASSRRASPCRGPRSSRPTTSCATNAGSRAVRAAGRAFAAPPLGRPRSCCARTRPARSGGTRSGAASPRGPAARSSSSARTCPRRTSSRARRRASTRRRCGTSAADPGTCRWGCRRSARRSPGICRPPGLETSEDQVLVTHGAQQAIGLAGALLVERGEAVVVEDPTYLGSIDIFSGRGARLITVPVGGRRGVDRPAQGDRRARLAAAGVPHADVPEPDRRGDAGAVPPRRGAPLARAAAADRRGQHARRPVARGPAAGADRGLRAARRPC